MRHTRIPKNMRLLDLCKIGPFYESSRKKFELNHKLNHNSKSPLKKKQKKKKKTIATTSTIYWLFHFIYETY